ncbi:MAG: hypothetical protein QOG52_1700 [Frankiaceae bacterium]|nr:hypothetical protein [Frankiaceae bacterium]
MVTVGVLTNLIGGGYHGEVIGAISHAASRLGARLIVVQSLPAGLAANARDDPPAPFLTDATARAVVDGWLVLPWAAQAAAIADLVSTGTPIVGISTQVPGGSAVVPDNAAGTRAAVDHLLAHGHRSIAFVGWLGQDDIRERYEAYRAAMVTAGLPILLYEATDNVESGGRAAAALMFADGLRCTATLAATDLNALALSWALAAAGVQLPAGQAVIGFDDIETGAHADPPLTSVRVRHRTLAAEATLSLLRIVAGKDPREGIKRIATSIVIRESCGCESVTTRHRTTSTGASAIDAKAQLRESVDECMAGLSPADLTPAGAGRTFDLVQHISEIIDAAAVALTPGDQATLAGLVTELVGQPSERTQLVGVVEAIKTYADAVGSGQRPLSDTAVARIYDTVAVASSAISDLQARVNLGGNAGLRTALNEQYEVVLDLLRNVEEDPRDLLWMRETAIGSACLGLWTNDEAPRRLRVAGVFGSDSAKASVNGTTVSADLFPPLEFLAGMRHPASDVVFVIPVLVNTTEWGLLALTASIDDRTTPRESFNYWAALLAVALEQAALLDSLRRNSEALTESVERERELTESIRQSETRYALAAAAASDGLWDWDVESGQVFWSPRLRGILGYEEANYYSNVEEWFASVHPDDVASLRARIDMRRKRGPRRMEHEYRMQRADGSYICALTRAIDVRGDDNVVTRVVGSFTDVTVRKALEEQLRQGALYDAITGLPNRTLFVTQVEKAIAQAKRSADYRFVVLFLDLDGFKVVNDSLGHAIGDLMLNEVGVRVRTVLRDGDTGARFGGDESAVLLTGVDIAGHHVVVTASVGVAGAQGGVGTQQAAEDIIRDADIAMYRAKSTEPGTHAVFDIRMHERAVQRLRTEVELRQAIRLGQLEVHYQPIVEFTTGTIRRVEALLRWRHPDRGLLPPSSFLAVAEEAGLMIPIGHWLLAESCRALAGWRREKACRGDVSVSVNVSHREFWHGSLVESVHEALRAAGLPPESLTLEITEGVIMDQPEQAMRTLVQLRDAGVGLHIDDFGTGYSSLQSLHRFPIRALKIDQSFVADVTTDSRSRELIRTIVMMGANLGVHVIAEGIESMEQRDALVSIGCVEGQGLWYSAALPGDQISEILSRPAPLVGRPPRSIGRSGPPE